MINHQAVIAKELLVSMFPEPPYFFLLAGLLVGVTSGLAFEATLKQLAQEWFRTRSTRTLVYLQGVQLQLPFLGICVGICIFLASGLEIFGFPASLSYVIAVSLTVLIALLVWSQLGKLLVQLERGGSRSIDLDSI
ncbi:hypothetical protein H6S82_16280 [Planktothrix sp. FACHB-1355]|uniref:Uncharacterized protein n=2 Tax=Cyanophyceae TaxID=3028117 RepID=A0A926VBD1_9CYAN|nr:hypothetical protein [Aerosakkonema funiforme FACHB-1375]MBD3560398.1 hypothetical protein [Planktothrix sp. FACHB-1355]